ncbi:GIY-YIG nuclease family protein [Aequorivita capsosiphonis]|uniref:GIY-YIG nuclease family protein n=1 Tax=Aequorivita capsosiphonis TaxID=487317 RepID=UPI00047D894F|nr:GIY-YIG nuclease family protein [Aequorivita capsosiphonis]
MNYYTYILYSAKLNRYYIGSTENVSTRLKEHLWKHKGFTAKAKDWELKYSEIFETKMEARKRETQMKKWKSRIMLEKLIHSQL